MAKGTKTAAAKIQKPDLSAAYDDTPYTSHPFPQTNPLLLQSIAKIFGLDAPDATKARVLEIGCSSGGNIMAFASCFPESTCVGIDYSKKQIDAGLESLKSLDIKNLTLKLMSVADVTKEFGEFDYIIAHGVWSWVPAEVRAKIMEVCKQNLAPNGIAYISYNVLPGWNSVRSLRDVMLYHTSHFEEPPVKAQQARALLQFLHESTKELKGPLAAAIEREINVLAKQPDYYLLHEHLEINNDAFYFHEFMTIAQQQGLQYLADTSVETMFAGNMRPEVAQVLATSNDIVRTEQFMDFITDRRFRQTLLCHNGVTLNRTVQPEIMARGYIRTRFSYPENFDKHNISSGQTLEFVSAGGLKLITSDPLVLALQKVLYDNRDEFVKMPEIVRALKQKMKEAKIQLSGEQSASIDNSMEVALTRYMFMGGLHFLVAPMPYTLKVSKKPVAPPLVRHQVLSQEWVTNRCMEVKTIGPFDRYLLRYLDGTRDIPALVKAMVPHFLSKELLMTKDNLPIDDVALIERSLQVDLPQRIELYARSSLLVA